MLDLVFSYFNNPHSTFMVQATFFFAVGVLFGPISNGILWFLLSAIVYEVIFWYFVGSCKVVPWSCHQRIALELVSLVGWIIGRVAYTGDAC